MKNQLKYTDFIFTVTFIFTTIFLGTFLFSFPYRQDEPFYITVPMRLVNGESLVSDEWHLTQFASLFSYLPTLLWVKLTGSTEGIVVFSRCTYLVVLSIITVVIYCFFRKYKLWAVVAAILYLTQCVYVTMQISYHSMFVTFLVLMSLSIIFAYEKDYKISYIFAGLFYGLCCICNPLFCFAAVLYLTLCVAWKYKEYLATIFLNAIESVENHTKEKTASTAKKNSKKKKSKKQEKKISAFISDAKSYNCLFSAKTICCTFFGLLIAAIIAVIFFLSTGGSVASVLSNMKNMLISSEYSSIGLFEKLNDIRYTYRLLSFFIPPILLALFFDKNRTKTTHRCAYLSLLLIAVIIHFVIVLTTNHEEIYSIEFPLYIFYLVCYIITKKKNKVLFTCFWIPGTVGAVFHLLSSASILPAFNLSLTASNIAGIFLAADLFKEIRNDLRMNFSRAQISFKVSQVVLSVALCSHILFHMVFIQSVLYIPDSDIKATSGPYAGINMTEKQYNDYSKSLADLNIIKEQSSTDSPVYIAGWQNWMYLHLERPVGAHTAYYLNSEAEVLRKYYKTTPDNIPEYIYLPLNDYCNNVYYDYPLEENLEKFNVMFDYDMEELSNGILLKITKYKPEIELN